MLRLLAKGGSSKTIAAALGYKEGSTRVYLHELYKKLGVNNRTAALLWYLDQSGNMPRHRAAAYASPVAWQLDQSFGDMALRTNLFAALGAMSMFLGAYGKTWEVGLRLKGDPGDGQTGDRRKLSRLLWEALLKGDFGCGKQLYEEDATDRLLADSPSDCILLGALLLIGGYSSAAERVMARIAKGRKGSDGITLSEFALIRALRDALASDGDDALACLHHLATDHSSWPTLRHVAMVSLYWAYRARKDLDRARGTANAIHAEAETARQQLQAMGERPLYSESELPRPAAANAKDFRNYLRKLTGAGTALKAG
jgi:hypothetical protein